MIDTIEKVLNPLFTVIFIFGCGNLRYPLDQPRYYLSIFYTLIVWSVYACAIYYIKIHYTLTLFNSYLFPFMITVNLSVTMISIIIIFCKHKKFHTCIRKLDLLNDTLKELGIPKEYYKLRNLVKWALFISFFIISTSSIFDCLLCTDAYNETKAIIIPIVMDYSLHISTITDTMFMLLLRYIGSKLEKINTYIVQLSEVENCGLRCKWKKSLVVNSYYIRNVESRKHILQILMHLHLELCRIARDINGFFGMQMTLQMLSYFVIIVHTFNFQYNTILNLKKKLYEDDTKLKGVLSITTWFSIHLIKLISFNHICERVSAEAQKTKDVIHKLTNLNHFIEVREEISQFVLQIFLRPLKFSGLGLFYFGYDFIRKFFAWIFTVVLFMMQIDAPHLFPSLEYFSSNITCHDITCYEQK